ADYQLRIFTPRSELPFAGHPTLGSAHAILEAGRVSPRSNGRLIQQCGVGFVEVDLAVDERSSDRQLTFTLPPAKITALQATDLADLESILGREGQFKTAPAIVNVGPIWVVGQLSDSASVLNLRPDLTRLAQFERRLGVTGLTVFGAHPHGD